MSWRPAKSLDVLLAEINRQFPRRDKASDGAKGDAAHASRKSDHNPNAAGVVRARDYDEDLHGAGHSATEMPVIAEHLRRMGEYGDHRLNGHQTGVNGYIIYEGHIAGAGKGWKWRKYTGPNAHLHHLHLSVCGDPGVHGYDDPGPWHVADLFNDRPQPQPEDDDMPKYVYTVPGIEGEFITDGLTTRTLSHPAVVHGKNRGWYVDANPKEMHADEHEWLVNNTKGLNVP